MNLLKYHTGLSYRTLGAIGVSLLALACGGSEEGVDTPTDVGTTPDVSAPSGPSTGPTDPTPTVTMRPAPPPPPPSQPEGNLARAAVEQVLRENCGSCHGAAAGPTFSGGFNSVEDIDALVADGRVIPSRAEESPIIVRMRNGTMPPAGVSPRPTEQEIDSIAAFINDPVLLPVPQANCANQEMTFDDVWEAILQDIVSADQDDAPNFRYISLSNRYNAGICTDSQEMDQLRQTVSKLVNSLSLENNVVRPTAIDSLQLIYRIDIRDYDFDVALSSGGVAGDDKWEVIAQLSPFAVEFEGDEADQVKNITGEAKPMIYADALVDITFQNDLYYDILEVVDRNTLLLDVDVDEADNQDQRVEARAGTQLSPVSNQDVIVSLNPSNFGLLAQRFDILDNNGDADIFTAGFGAFDNVEVLFDESQAAFNLPNGMLGYAIFDANGNRLNESEILLDRISQADLVARAGVSCSGCHAQGFLPVADQVAGFVEENPFEFDNADDREDAEELFDAVNFKSNLELGNSDLQIAMQRAGVPVRSSDPIQSTYIRFDRDLTLSDVAGDLGVTPEVLERQLSRLSAEVDPQLATVNGGSIDRDDFEDLFLAAVCTLGVTNENQPLIADCDAALAALQ